MHTTGTPETLLRSRDDRIIAGVAGGLGEYYKVDSVLIRFAFIGLAFVGGLGFLLYLIGYLVMPEASDGDGHRPVYRIDLHPQRSQIGSLLIAIGLIALFINLNILTFHIVGRFWPIILIIIGLVALRRRN